MTSGDAGAAGASTSDGMNLLLECGTLAGLAANDSGEDLQNRHLKVKLG